MHKETGEVRVFNEIPKKEIKDDKWSEPFHKGEIVEFKGVEMEIIRIKKQRKEIHLRHHGKN